MARDQTVQKNASGGLATWQAELSVRLLLDDICNDFPIADLAVLCGLSRSYFVKAFKASVGTAPHRWLVRQRVQRASEMLEQTDETISAIALACGFSDQSHLTRVFRASVGTSPAAWRRQRRAGFAPAVPPVASLGLGGRFGAGGLGQAGGRT